MKRPGHPRHTTALRPTSDAHQEVLAAAERLFAARGYLGVTLRDIADALGMRQASLYYHAPEGKEQLFEEAFLLRLRAFDQRFAEVLATVPVSLPGQLEAIATWLLGQPPLDVLRLYRSDLPALHPERAERLGQRAHDTFLAPLERLFDAAVTRGEVRRMNAKLLATSYLSTIEAIHDLHRLTGQPQAALATEAISVLLEGLQPR